ncbi:MAG: cobalamin biosynthesis protein [Candidatus Competibacter sp.]|nr:cobalamin biosynthesis protein [Candidatus Competibacter sp.]MDG4607343.1 adenosylcobinamide-phosphate synthase CbiB [Candidatus Contendobacter sp.]HRD48510.1 adenosylcobinamide-phosphate synthase CbiB [Candidatus Contendobacter sp.]
MLTALLCIGAVLLDRRLGEPRRLHPLVGFGGLAQRVEALAYGPPELSATARRERGIGAVIVLLTPFTVAVWLLAKIPLIGLAVALGLLYLALGAHSLAQHAEAVAAALHAGDLPLARQKVALIVSRDTDDLDEEGISRATVESVLENGCDAIFGALFWFVLAGAGGVVLYRLTNTLDALWGYRTPRYLHFGWAAARLDDALNWLPARLTALSYTLAGSQPAVAWRCWQAQAPGWKSPNAGPVMAAGAGALGLALGGPARYHGEWQSRPALGEGLAPCAEDIGRAVALVQRALWLWLAAILLGGLALA